MSASDQILHRQRSSSPETSHSAAAKNVGRGKMMPSTHSFADVRMSWCQGLLHGKRFWHGSLTWDECSFPKVEARSSILRPSALCTVLHLTFSTEIIITIWSHDRPLLQGHVHEGLLLHIWGDRGVTWSSLRKSPIGYTQHQTDEFPDTGTCWASSSSNNSACLSWKLMSYGSDSTSAKGMEYDGLSNGSPAVFQHLHLSLQLFDSSLPCGNWYLVKYDCFVVHAIPGSARGLEVEIRCNCIVSKIIPSIKGLLHTESRQPPPPVAVTWCHPGPTNPGYLCLHRDRPRFSCITS